MKLKSGRGFDKKIDFSIYEINELSTLNTTEEELWLKLETLTNLEQANYFLYSKLGHKAGIEKEISPKLSEFIKQGKIYYKQAELADFSISPLLFYYGMLNLVKAYILTREPYLIIPKTRGNFDKSSLSHGVSAGNKIKKDFSIYKENVYLQNSGIFAHYNKLLSGNKISSLKIDEEKGINEKRISIINILSHCMDISEEFNNAFKKKKNLVSIKIEILKNGNRAWNRLIFHKKETSYRNLISRKLELSKYQRIKCENPNLIVFEEKTTFSFSNEKNLHSQSRKRIKPLNIIFSEGFNKKIQYALPITDTGKLNTVFQESLSIYLGMYYFGSIVRYQPYVLKNIYPLKEGLIIKSFIRTCSKKFLRLITYQIFEKIYIFNET